MHPSPMLHILSIEYKAVMEDVDVGRNAEWIVSPCPCLYWLHVIVYCVGALWFEIPFQRWALDSCRAQTFSP